MRAAAVIAAAVMVLAGCSLYDEPGKEVECRILEVEVGHLRAIRPETGSTGWTPWVHKRAKAAGRNVKYRCGLDPFIAE